MGINLGIGEATEAVKNLCIEELVEIGKVPENEARREVEAEYDWEGVREDFEKSEFGMVACSEYPKVREGLELVRKKDPSLHTKLKDRCFVLSPEFYPKAAGTMAPMTIDKHRNVAVIISGAHVEFMSEKGLARTLAHEGVHIDFDERPEKYGVKSEAYYGVKKLFGGDEEIITKELERLGLEKYRESVNSEAWGRARYKIWLENIVFRITALVKGRESRPRYWI